MSIPYDGEDKIFPGKHGDFPISNLKESHLSHNFGDNMLSSSLVKSGSW